MSGKRRNPGVKGRNPHLKAMRQREAEERRLKHEAEGSPRSKKKRLALLAEAKLKAESIQEEKTAPKTKAKPGKPGKSV